MPQQQPYQLGGTAGYEMLERHRDDTSSGLLPDLSTQTLRNEKRMGGRYSDIARSFLVLTIPMLGFVCVLAVLVFHYRVQSKGAPFENLRLSDNQDEKGVYYVNISSPTLVFIASWSSSLAPALASFALALVTYPAAKTYLREERAETHEKLLTPYQLFLTLQFLDGGGIGAIWSWLVICYDGENCGRVKQARYPPQRLSPSLPWVWRK